MADALEYPVNSLASFHYFRRIDIREFTSRGMRMIADSGAFSALSLGEPIDIDEFAEWAKRYQDDFAWIASLDVIGDVEGTWRNYRHLRDRHRLPVVPTVHYGAHPSVLDRYADDGVDFVGLGGMVGRKSQPAHLLRWALAMFRYARDQHPQMRFHGWGVTHPKLTTALPWYSIDSSGAGAAYRYGRLSLYDPRKRKRITVKMDGRDVFRHRDLLRRYYGVEPRQIATSSGATRPALVRASTRSYQLLERDLQRKFRVAPPRYGDRLPQQGPNVHAVDAAPNNLRFLANDQELAHA